MGRNDREKTGPGSIADVVAQLAVWARRAPWGFARVEYHSEHARAEVDRRLGEILLREQVPYHHVSLPVRVTPSQAWRSLIEQLETIDSGTVSIAGLVTAVPEEIRRDWLATLSARREVLAELRLCLIWWMTPDFVDLLIRKAIDLDSWFMVRLKIEEEIRPTTGPWDDEPVRPTAPKSRVGDVLSRAADLVERFERAQESSHRDSQLIELAAAAAGAIADAGVPHLTRCLADRLMAGLTGVCKEALPDCLSTVRDLNRFASLLVKHGRIRDAEPLVARATAIVEQDKGADDTVAIGNLCNLAVLQFSMNRIDRAEGLLRRALAIAEGLHGDRHPVVAQCFNRLGWLLWRMGRLGEAEAAARRGLWIDEQSAGANHPQLAIDLYNLTLVLVTANRLTEAEPLARRALEIDERWLGPDDPQVAADLSHLAVLLRKMKRLDEAEPLIRRALAIDEPILGPDHPVVAFDLINLAALLRDLGRRNEAEPLVRRALEIDGRVYGPKHPAVVRDRERLSSLPGEMNRPNEVW